MLIDRELIKELEDAIGYRFNDYDLLERAFIHPSADNIEKPTYERLEFLGDEVVGLGISTLLFNQFPQAGEGMLSKARSNIIDEQGLAHVSRQLNLGDMLILGRGEDLHGGREKESILSDVFESLMAVIYVESGWQKVFDVIDKIFMPLISGAPTIEELLMYINRDYKTRLQEIAQNLELPLPVYDIVSKEGPEHDLVFTVECKCMGYVQEGVGRNKKSAEQDAARLILLQMRAIKIDASRR